MNISNLSNVSNLSDVDLEIIINDSYDNGLTIRETAYNIGLPVEAVREFSKSIGVDWSGTETIDKRYMDFALKWHNVCLEVMS